MTGPAELSEVARVSGHGGRLALAAVRDFGIDTMFTLSGAHVFPLYDAAVTGEPPVRLVDTRHEQTAVFAAEATARLTRRPGLAVVTAGPGVTNAVSAVTTAWLNGSPLLLLGGRAATASWGNGSLQELDHPPLLAPVTKRAATVRSTAEVAAAVAQALRLATTPHRGPVFLDLPLEVVYGEATVALPKPAEPVRQAPDPADVEAAAAVLASAERPVLVLGSDVWTDQAEQVARSVAEGLRLPVVANDMARGVLPAGHELLATKARGTVLKGADVVVVVGAPLDFRLGYGVFGGGAARVVHVADSPGQVAAHAKLAASVSGSLPGCLTDLAAAVDGRGGCERPDWLAGVAAATAAALAAEEGVLTADSDPIHPARVVGEVARALAGDAVVVGDGGDFVSYAGKHLELDRPGSWLSPGPFGCLGFGPGAAIAARLARPSAQVVLLLGDGAAGFSLTDVDTMVRHRLPVVMVCSNNDGWGLEKHPMRALYGYDVVADLRPGTRYDQVVTALGGAGETVTRPDGIAAALRRAFDAGVPYLVNVVTDPAVAYARTTNPM